MSLTDEDKQWFNTAINTAINTAVDTAINTAVNTAINTAINTTINTAVDASERRLYIALERVGTSLLTAFHAWASPMDMRVRSHSLTLRALDLEMEAIGERVTRLEPPH